MILSLRRQGPDARSAHAASPVCGLQLSLENNHQRRRLLAFGCSAASAQAATMAIPPSSIA